MCCYYVVHTDIVDLLISRGADIESTVYGETALILAAQQNYRDCGELLIARSAELNTIADDALVTASRRSFSQNPSWRECVAPRCPIEDRAKGYTALEMADRRRPVPPEWMPKFQELINSVVRSNQNTHANTASAPSDVEDFEDVLEHQD
ncbi:hypothetical protein MMC14_002286 [Varicellaria rhodocarpa]|nr:hypothetical protein [Varicellaria rhodocarpa]